MTRGEGTIPAYVSARVRGQADGHAALIVRGRIAAVRPVQPDGSGGDGRLWAVLAEQLLPDGRSDLEVAMVEGSPAAPSLQPVSIRPSS